MSDYGKFSRGRLKGKKVTFADTARIDDLSDIASEFMDSIFDLMPGDYLISDESDIRDFTEFGSGDVSGVWVGIKQTYGIERQDVESGLIVQILLAIALRRNPQ